MTWVGRCHFYAASCRIKLSLRSRWVSEVHTLFADSRLFFFNRMSSQASCSLEHFTPFYHGMSFLSYTVKYQHIFMPLLWFTDMPNGHTGASPLGLGKQIAANSITGSWTVSVCQAANCSRPGAAAWVMKPWGSNVQKKRGGNLFSHLNLICCCYDQLLRSCCN